MTGDLDFLLFLLFAIVFSFFLPGKPGPFTDVVGFLGGNDGALEMVASCGGFSTLNRFLRADVLNLD